MRTQVITILAAALAAPTAVSMHALEWYPGTPEPVAVVEPARVCAEAQSGDIQDLPERDEIRRTVQLRPGARVEVASINGSVVAETWDGTQAEILVVRSAHKRADLDFRRVNVEATDSSLLIKGDEERGRRGGPDVRQRVVLRLPRSIDLTIRGINGKVSAGAIDGMVHVNGINGKVEIAHAMSTTDISGINGKVSIALTRLAAEGMTISGVNGKVELQFSEDLNADISVTGINGNVVSEIGNITIQGKMSPSSFRGKIGAGGPPITVSGVNGNVRLLREGTILE
jgi:hypothetical protein